MPETPRTIIHLLDWSECGPPAAWSIAALRAHSPQHTHRVLLLAPPDRAPAAEQWLAAPPDAIRPITPARLSLPRTLINDDEPATLIAWSPRALRLAHRLRRRNVQLAAFFLRPPDRANARLLATLAPRGRAAFASHWSRQASGLADAPVLPLPIPSIPPRADAPNRQWLGIVDANNRSTFTAVGWPGRAVSATRASYITGVLAIGGRSATAIVPDDAEDLERATRFAHRHNDAWPVFAVDPADPRAVAAADVALWCGHPGAMLDADGKLPRGMRTKRPAPLAESLLLPLALGVPIVAESVPATRELLAESSTDPQATPPRWLTPVGDRLAMNRAAYAMLTDADDARTAFNRHAQTITAARDPARFAASFTQWIEACAAPRAAELTPAPGATSS